MAADRSEEAKEAQQSAFHGHVPRSELAETNHPGVSKEERHARNAPASIRRMGARAGVPLAFAGGAARGRGRVSLEKLRLREEEVCLA